MLFLVESRTIVVEQNKYARKIVSLLPPEEAQEVHEVQALRIVNRNHQTSRGRRTGWRLEVATD
jgi:hypothetical protein